MPDKITVAAVAEVCHEANRVLQKRSVGSIPVMSPAWDDCTAEQRVMVTEGVINILTGEVTEPGQSHESWCRFKLDHGWIWGERKDEAARTHPSLVPFHRLSQADQAKDVLFFAIVKALADLPHD